MNEQRNESLLPPADPDSEPTDANPVPLSPTDPKRRTSAGDTPPAGDTTLKNAPFVPIPATGQTGGTGGALPAAVVPVARPDKNTGEKDVRPDSEGAV